MHGDGAGQGAWAGSGRPPVILVALLRFPAPSCRHHPTPHAQSLGLPPCTPAAQLRRDLWRPGQQR